MWKKYLLAFAIGALLLGGGVYFGRRSAQPAVPTQADVQPVQTQPAAPQTSAQEQAPPARESDTVREPVVRPPKHESKHASAEPRSATAPPAQPVEVAQAQPQPPIQPQPEAQPQPPVAQQPPQEQPSRIVRPDAAMEKQNRTPQTVTIPKGTALAVRLRQSIGTDKQSEGDVFYANLDQPLVINGFVIADRGADVRGKITLLTRAARKQGRGALTLELTQISTTDGQQAFLHTDAFHQEAPKETKENAMKVGGIAALGAVIGAIAGGGKGAAIGAGAGGAAGGGTVLATKGGEVRLPSESRLTFRLTEPLTLTEKLN